MSHPTLAESATVGVTLDRLQAIMPRLPAEKAAAYLPHLNAAMWEFEIAVMECTDAACRHGDDPEHPTPARMAAFLAQLAFESRELTRLEEIPWTEYRCACGWKGRKLPDPLVHSATGHEVRAVKYPDCYEGRRNLGNTQPGDGVRFKGRGPIQLTGRANYRAASLALFPTAFADFALSGRVPILEAHPEMMLKPEVGFRVAGWFWARARTHCHRSLSDVADSVVGVADAEVARRLFNHITKAINGGLNGAAQRWAYYLRARKVLG